MNDPVCFFLSGGSFQISDCFLELKENVTAQWEFHSSHEIKRQPEAEGRAQPEPKEPRGR